MKTQTQDSHLRETDTVIQNPPCPWGKGGENSNRTNKACSQKWEKHFDMYSNTPIGFKCWSYNGSCFLFIATAKEERQGDKQQGPLHHLGETHAPWVLTWSWMIFNLLDVLTAVPGTLIWQQALASQDRHWQLFWEGLSYIFKPSRPGTTAAMEASLLRRSHNLTGWATQTWGQTCIVKLRLTKCFQSTLWLMFLVKAIHDWKSWTQISITYLKNVSKQRFLSNDA